MNQSLGGISGSRASTEPQERPGPTGFDPGRVCEACPFAETEASIQAQNWGCLPTPWEVFAIRDETGCNWGCHGRDSICAGYVAACRDRGLAYRSMPTLNHVHWAHQGHGIAAAIAMEARQGPDRETGLDGEAATARPEGIAR